MYIGALKPKHKFKTNGNLKVLLGFVCPVATSNVGMSQTLKKTYNTKKPPNPEVHIFF